MYYKAVSYGVGIRCRNWKIRQKKRWGFLRCRNSKKYDKKITTGEIKWRNRASLSDFQQKYDKNFVVFFCRNSAREAARLIQTTTRRETRTHSRHKNVGPLRPCVGSSSDTSLAPPQPGTSLAPQQRGIHARTRFEVRQHGAPHGVRERWTFGHDYAIGCRVCSPSKQAAWQHSITTQHDTGNNTPHAGRRRGV